MEGYYHSVHLQFPEGARMSLEINYIDAPEGAQENMEVSVENANRLTDSSQAPG